MPETETKPKITTNIVVSLTFLCAVLTIETEQERYRARKQAAVDGTAACLRAALNTTLPTNTTRQSPATRGRSHNPKAERPETALDRRPLPESRRGRVG